MHDPFTPPPGVSVHASDGWAFRPAAAAQVHVGGSAAHVSMLADSGGLSVVCASAAGSVRRCDLRAGGPFEELYNSPNVSSLAAHASAAVVAAGSRQQRLKIYDLNNRTRFTVKAHSDFWGSRLGAVSCLRFHPAQPLLAVGATSDHLSVFSYGPASFNRKIDVRE